MGAPSGPRTLAVLGSTGALGQAALSKALAHPQRIRITALAAGSRVAVLAAQAEEVCRASGTLPTLAVAAERDADALRERLRPFGDPEVLTGPTGLARLAAAPGATTVLCAVSGLTAFPAAEAAARAGRLLLLASKEVLALAGAGLQALAAAAGGRLEPLDSELSAAARLVRSHAQSVAAGLPGHRLLLTASGGPLWQRPARDLPGVTPAEVLRHPIWPLGPKIAVDSATQLNKAHEVVAAAQLFGMGAEAISVAIHPEARIHAVLGLPDGAEVALAAPADMRGPLVDLLGLPGDPPSARWSLEGPISINQPDLLRFPGVLLGHRALSLGAGGRAALVGIDEAAVAAFLGGRLPFPAITEEVAAALEKAPACSETLPDLLTTATALRDAWTRRLGPPH